MALVPLKKDASGQWTYWDDVRGAEVNGQGEILRTQGAEMPQIDAGDLQKRPFWGALAGAGEGAGAASTAGSAGSAGSMGSAAGSAGELSLGEMDAAGMNSAMGTGGGQTSGIGAEANYGANQYPSTPTQNFASPPEQKGKWTKIGESIPVVGPLVGSIAGAIEGTDKTKTQKYNEQLLATKLDMTRMAYRNRGGDEVVGFIAEEKARGLRYRPFVVMLKARTALGRELTPEERTSISRGGYGTVSQTQANELAYTQKQQGQRATANTVLQGTAMAFLTAVGLRLGKRLLLGA